MLPRVTLLGFVAMTLAIGALSIGASPAAAGPPPLEPIEVVSEIPNPPAPGFMLINGVGRALFAPDENWLILRVLRGSEHHVAVMRADGRDFRCLSCGLGELAGPPAPFPDEERLLVGGGDELDAQSQVLECSPSIYRCDERRLVPVTFPIDSLFAVPIGALNREVGLHPDGVHIKWNEVRTNEGQRMVIGTLVRRGDDYGIVDPHVMSPRYSLSDDIDDWTAGASFYEAQGYTDGWIEGGRVIKYGSMESALNYDIFELDLTTGQRRRLTTDSDYNENADYSRDSRWVAYASARGLDRMDVWTQLRRPALIDMVSFPAIGGPTLTNNRRCMNERWLMSRDYGQRLGGYAGQPVIIEDNYAIRAWSWSEDGTRALIGEDPVRREVPAQMEMNGDFAAITRGARLRIVRFPARKPRPPDPIVTLTEADLARSTVPYAEYRGMASQAVPQKTLRGKHSGTATVSYSGQFFGGRWEVRFADYSDDGESFVAGVESLETPNPIVRTRYAADLTVRGRDNGFLRADVLTRGAPPQGSVVSEVNGRRLEGFPTQADCPGLRQPRLRARVVGRRRVSGDRTVLTLAVTARVPDDRRARPVRHVQVRVPRGPRTLTDRRGRARLVLPRSAKPIRIRAWAGSFKQSSLHIKWRS